MPYTGNGPATVTASGLRYADEAAGTGPEAKAGDTVEVHYTGTFKDGKKFDGSRDANEPYRFKLGAAEVIKGWDEGIAGMKVGGKRRLVIPPELAYGKKGSRDGVIRPVRRMTRSLPSPAFPTRSTPRSPCSTSRPAYAPASG